MSKENLHFDDQSKQAVFIFIFIIIFFFIALAGHGSNWYIAYGK